MNNLKRLISLIPNRVKIALILLLIYALTILVSISKGRSIAEEEYCSVISEKDSQIEYLTQMVDAMDSTRKTDNIVNEAEAIAKVLYGMRFNSTQSLMYVVNVIVNRAESPLYPDSIIEICETPSQWVGYYDNNIVTSDLYDIAYNCLRSWSSGGYRYLDSDYLWFDWSSTEITFRNTFEMTSTTKYITVN